MPKETAKRKRPDTYRFHTLRPLNNLLFVLPMLLAFQVGAFFYGTNLLATHHLRSFLEYFGATAAVLPGMLVVLVLLAQHLVHRDPWQLQPKVLAGMVGESVIWMVPLIVLIGLVGRMQATAGANPVSAFQEVLQAFGAGVYEEFIFRLALVSVVLMVFVDILGLKKEAMTVVAVILAAGAFSLYHLSPEQLADTSLVPWPAAVFRTVAGVYLGALYVFRGFGIAAGAHAFYNIYAVAAQ